jgi:hypothetical protein
MAVPNYTYLKLKMLGPKGVITVRPSYEHAYECDVECVEHGKAILESMALAVDHDGWPRRSLTPNGTLVASNPQKTSNSYPSTLPTWTKRL